MTALDSRLDLLRGVTPARNHDARTIAALTTNPGCVRRGLLDAAGADKESIARHVGHPARFGQSQFAITRGNVFEAQVKANGCAETGSGCRSPRPPMTISRSWAATTPVRSAMPGPGSS